MRKARLCPVIAKEIGQPRSARSEIGAHGMHRMQNSDVAHSPP